MDKECDWRMVKCSNFPVQKYGKRVSQRNGCDVEVLIVDTLIDFNVLCCIMLLQYLNGESHAGTLSDDKARTVTEREESFEDDYRIVASEENLL